MDSIYNKLRNVFLLLAFMLVSVLIHGASYADSLPGSNCFSGDANTFDHRLSVHNTTLNISYATIQDALNEAKTGDVIMLDAGTYPEALTVGKSVTILGPNHKISPNAGHGKRLPEAIVMPQGGADAISILSDHISLTIKGLVISMEQSGVNNRYLTLDNNMQGVELRFLNNVFQYAQRIGTRGNAAWFFDRVSVDIAFINNLFYHNAPSNGILIHDNLNGSAVSHINILNNVWKNNGAWAMNLHNVHGTISGNTITNDGFLLTQWDGWTKFDRDPEWPGQFGIVLANHNNNISIFNNQFIDLSGPGIRIWNSFNGSLFVTGNDFIDNKVAAVNVNHIEWHGSLDHVVFRDNTFNGNQMAFDNQVENDLDARYNKWGFPTGPYHHALNVYGQGDTVSNNVIFEPWWYHSVMHETSPVRIHGNNSKFNAYADIHNTGSLNNSLLQGFNGSDAINRHFNMYPNPVRNGRLNIEFESSQFVDAKILIHDTKGGMVKQKSFDGSAGSLITINVANLPNGIYYLRVIEENYVSAEKFVVAD